MYKYSLHNKSIKHKCPNCDKKRFVLYIDNETGKYLSDKIGRCDREVKCGYHYTPKSYFQDKGELYNPTFKNYTQPKVLDIKPSYHSNEVFNKSLQNYNKNNFIVFLRSKFSKEQVNQILNMYAIGTASFWYDNTIFWQIDQEENIHGGKIIKYEKNGKRTKYISWVHSYFLKKNKLQKFNLKQCFFGEHLLAKSDKIIAIVESEKTACIMSIIFDKYTWLATGSLSGLNSNKMHVLKNRRIVLYPDLGINTQNKTPYNLWKNKCLAFRKIGFDINISNLLEKNASDKQRENGLDIADYFINKKPHQPITILSKVDEVFSRLLHKNKNIIHLIDQFQLTKPNGEAYTSE